MITSVYIDTDELVFQLHSVSDDAQKALEWVRSFRDTLMFGARIANPLPFAMECMAMSEGFSASGVLGKLRAAARKRLNDEGIEATPESIDAEIVRTQGADAVREIMAKIERANSLKAEIRRRKFTAAATTREGVDVVPNRESGSLVRTTGCKHSQEAPTRKAGDESSDAGNGAALKSATSCNQLTADGDIREDSRNVTDGSNAGTLESGTSANNSGEGGTPGIERKSASLPSPTPIKTDPKPTKKAKAEVKPEEQKYPHGEFENIMLTTDEYIKLCERLDNADELIAEADQYFEAQPDKKKKYKNHYAMLLSWDRRRKEAEGPKRGYKNINDINRETYEKAKREIHAMFHPEEAKAV